jgi:outer membrane lipoprotein-sorting protein
MKTGLFRAMKTGLFAVVATLAALLLTSAVDSHDSCTGNFSAKMELGPKASPMKFDGKLAWSNPKLRLDLKDQTTKEAMVVLVDFKSNDATLLYPDTLNGMKTKLPSMDTSGYIRQFKHLLASGGSEMDKGWKKSKVGSEKVGSASATKYKLTGPKGEEVYWWVDKNNQPKKMQTGRGDKKVTLNFGALNFGASVPAKTFTYSKDFQIIEMSGEAAKKSLPKH